MTDEQIKLLQTHIALEKEFGQTFVDMSVSDTISKLFLLGHGNRATKVKSDFKVPDKRFCWLRIKVFIQVFFAFVFSNIVDSKLGWIRQVYKSHAQI